MSSSSSSAGDLAAPPPPRCFVTSDDPRLDFTDALHFSPDIVSVFPPGQVHLSPQIALKRARGVLRDMRRGDYLVLVGDPVKIAICAVVAAEKAGEIRFLRWNKHTKGYVEVKVDFLSFPHFDEA